VPTRLVVEAESGLLVFKDGSLECPFQSDGPDERRKTLRDGEQDGRWFYFDIDDPVTYRFDVVVGEGVPPLPEHRFQNLGGTFLLRLDGGRFSAADGNDWSGGENSEIAVMPGSYALTVLGDDQFDRHGYEDEMRGLLGDRDWKYRTRIDRLGLFGCLSTLGAAVLLLIPATRSLWWVAMAALAVGWLPFLLLQLLPRYQNIDRRIKEYEAALPHFVLKLEAITDTKGLSGGHLSID